MSIRSNLRLKGSRTLLLIGFAGGTIAGSVGPIMGATLLGSDVFDDVQRGSYYDSAVGAMYGDGIIKGYDGTDNFGPDDFVTRAQVAVMLQRFKDGGGVVVSSKKSSSSSSSVASSNASTSTYGSFRLTTSGFSVAENYGSVTMTVLRTGGRRGTVSVDYSVGGGTATSGTDYEAASGTLEFEEDEGSKTFTLKIKEDNDAESDETMVVTLSNAKNHATIISPSSATVTITDNDSGGSNSSGKSSSKSSGSSTATNTKGTLSFAAHSYEVNENAGSIAIAVQRSGGSSDSVSINYATSNGTAGGNDYSSTNGSLSFAAGETSKTFSVPITDDTSIAGSKTFTVTLSSPGNGASLGSPSTATVTINDDESTSFGSGSLKFSKSEYNADEDDGKVDVIVQRVGGTQGTITVNYATTNGSALPGVDYTNASGTLTFAPGESSKSIAITLVKDSTSESGDTFYVDLSSPSSTATLLSPNTTTINLYD